VFLPFGEFPPGFGHSLQDFAMFLALGELRQAVAILRKSPVQR
jgi:hypothetical protein